MKLVKRFWVFVLICLFVSCSSDVPQQAQYTRSLYTLEMVDGNLVSDKKWVKTVFKEKDKDFVILNLTDIQLGTSAYLANYERTFKLIDKLIKSAQPDLITITGDISYGCSVAFYGICSFINSYNIPWAPVFGNHDFDNSGIDIKEEAEILSHYSNCLFADGPKSLAFDEETGQEALGNYVVNIVEKEDSNFKIAKSLIFMNSAQDGISKLQMQWYEDCVKSLKDGETVTRSAVFLHIPVHGFYHANKAAIKDRNASVADSYNLEKSSLVWNNGYENSFGVAHFGFGPAYDDGFAEIMESCASTDLIVCGHYHANCSCIKYEGITYLYSLKTGAGYSYEEDMCGGTAITINSSGGSVVNHIFEVY